MKRGERAMAKLEAKHPARALRAAGPEGEGPRQSARIEPRPLLGPRHKERRGYASALIEVQRACWQPCLLLGKLFYCLTRELDATSRFITYNPGIVPRRDDIGVARTYLHLRAIIHNDLHLTR